MISMKYVYVTQVL